MGDVEPFAVMGGPDAIAMTAPITGPRGNSWGRDDAGGDSWAGKRHDGTFWLSGSGRDFGERWNTSSD